jgi:hypothetical protein
MGGKKKTQTGPSYIIKVTQLFSAPSLFTNLRRPSLRFFLSAHRVVVNFPPLSGTWFFFSIIFLTFHFVFLFLESSDSARLPKRVSSKHDDTSSFGGDILAHISLLGSGFSVLISPQTTICHTRFVCWVTVSLFDVYSLEQANCVLFFSDPPQTH